MNLLQMSFTGAILILAVIVVRAVAINKLPKRTFLALWGIVLLRLLIPFSIPSELSVYSVVNRSIPVRETESDVEISDFIPTAQAGQPVIDDNILRARISQGNQVNAYVSNVHVPVWIIIWCVGTILFMAFLIISYLRWSFEFKTSLPVSDTFITQWLEEHQLKRIIAIRQSSRVEAPLTYGILHPVILMPEKTDWENKQQLRYILLHEYVHICRYDIVAKLISAIALCIHWFNPMVWVMYILFNRDIELACDEGVIRKFGENSKSEYALTLIGMEEKKSGFMPICNNFSKNAIEERIKAVMKIKKTSFAAIIAAVALVACVTTAFATSAITDNKQSTANTDNEQSTVMSGTDISDKEYEITTKEYEIPADEYEVQPDTTNVSFISGMGCSDPNCTDATHHHDCPTDCGDYEHHHNCGMDCTIASHHHAHTESGEAHHDESVAVYNVSFVSGMGCSDTNCTDATHHHDCPTDCGDYEHHHNCGLDCTEASHHHAYTESGEAHHDESVAVYNVSFVSGMGCSDTNCTDASHHHDCPINCGDYEHHHNCGLDCTIASHHHSGTSAVSGTTQQQTTQSHSGQHHKDDHH